MRKNFLWYNFIRLGVVRTGLKFFYKRIRIIDKHKIPKGKPILLVPNHQNSFMDALLVTTHFYKTTSFLTRAQAFESKFMDWFLRSLNLLPVYRVRDGISNIQKNNEIFETCIRFLSNNEAVLVFAEANHDLKRRLRPFSKGFTRIAFDAEIINDWNLDLYVQPVGVNYSDHQNSRNEVRVVFGDPIKVSDYRKEYEESERSAANSLKNQTSDNLKPLIMHVPKLDQYPLIKIALDEMEPDRAKLSNNEYMNTLVQNAEELQTPELISDAERVLEVAEKNKLSVRALSEVKLPIIKRILLAPIYLLVWLNGIIPYQPARYIIKNKIQDKAFDVSIKFVLGLFLFPLFYLLVTCILLIAGVPAIWAWGYFLVSLFTSTMFKRANELVRNLKEKKKIQRFKLSNPDIFNDLKAKLARIAEFRKVVIKGE
jgi:1-acyl-sn-glycerol-3-phosphate acyltransferase|tara:strand:+ start:26219 stop:27499 length:1281 start_codon:yes stop_codon:yes gene_type:complete